MAPHFCGAFFVTTAAVSALQLIANFGKCVRQFRADASHGGDSSNCDKRRNQAILDCRGALLVFRKFVQKFHGLNLALNFGSQQR